MEEVKYQTPPPPSLPKVRVSPLATFEVTGTDYTGVLDMHINMKIVKYYEVLFTCANMKAIHLEMNFNPDQFSETMILDCLLLLTVVYDWKSLAKLGQSEQ